MTHLMEQLSQSPFVHAMGWTLAHFVWQGCAVAGLLAVMLVAMRRSKASARYTAACGALLLMAALPIVTMLVIYPSIRVDFVVGSNVIAGRVEVAPRSADFPLHPSRIQGSSNASPSAGPALAADEHAWINAVERRFAASLPWCVAAWLLGVLVLSLRLIIGWARLRSVRGSADGLPTDWSNHLVSMAKRVCVLRPVRLLAAVRVDVPCTFGWLAPIILVPVGAMSDLSPEQVRAILAHELAHIRRHDYLANLLQSMIESLLFYHPAVWWVSRQIRIERENCCDDIAADACGSPVTYARALSKLEAMRGYVPSLAAAAKGGALLPRIQRLLSPRTEVRPVAWWPACAMMALVIALGCIAAHVAHAQQEPKPTTASTTVLFSGKVVNSEGQPAAGALVKAFSINREDIKPIESTHTGSDGRFEIHGTEPKARAVVGLVIQGAANQMACLRDMAGTRSLQIKLHPAAELVVNLVDANGKPMRGLHLSLAKPRGGGFENAQFPYFGIDTRAWITDDKGQAHIKPLPLGSSVTLQLDDAQFARLPLTAAMVAISQPVTKSDPIPVGPASSIEGRVVASETNQPIADIPVSAYFHEGGTVYEADAPTNTNGDYHISRVPAGVFNIRVRLNHEQSKTWLPATKTITTGPGQDLMEQNLSLSHGAMIVGKILESGSDRPLAGASVEARTLQARNRIYLGNSDAKGEYTLRLPPGTYRLNINAARVIGSFDPNVSMGDTTVEDGKTYTRDFALRSKSPEAAAKSITGHVVDQQGRPVARASIVVWNHSEAGSFVHPTASRSDGSFSISNAPDHVTLRAFAPTAKAATAEPIEALAGSKDVVLHLVPWPTVHGRVVDSDGNPLAGAVIAVAIEIEPKAFVFYTVGPTIQTDEKGQYEAPVPLPGLRYAVYTTETGLAAHQSDYMPALKAGESQAQSDMVLKKADSFVAGRVVDEQGHGAANVAVRTNGSDSPGRTAGTDANGNFRIVHIADAEYELSAYRAPSERGTIHAKAGTSDNVLRLHPTTQPGRGAP